MEKDLHNRSIKPVLPGDKIKSMLEERGMTQKELALRIGMTDKHISTVISGKKKFLCHLLAN